MMRNTWRLTGLVALGFACCCGMVHAATNLWLPGNGEWNTGVNWSPANVPGVQDMALITNVTASYTVSYSNVMAAASISNLTLSTLGAPGANIITLTVSTNGFNISGGPTSVLGYRSVLNVNTGGVVVVGSASPGFTVDSGTLNINGGAFTNNAASLYVAVNDVYAGRINVNSGILVDNSSAMALSSGGSGAPGYLNNYGGTVVLKKLIVSNYQGAGVVTNAGGLLVLQGTGGLGLELGHSGAGKGTVVISGGVVSNLAKTIVSTVTAGKICTITQTGGTWYQGGDMTLGNNGGTTGVVTYLGSAAFVGQSNVNLGVFTTNGIGNLTIGGSSIITLTNTKATAAMNVIRGTLAVTGGVTWVDNLVATNGAPSVINFSAGVVNVKTAQVSNGSAFVVGNGISAATLDLLGGSNTFANGLTINTNATLVIGGINALGTSLVNGNLALNSNASLNWDCNATTQDWVVVTGTVSLPASVTVNVTSLDGAPRRTIPLMKALGGFVGSPSAWPRVSLFGVRYTAEISGDTLVMTTPPKTTALLFR